MNELHDAICLFGATEDTGNLGVSALCHSVLAGLARHDPRSTVVVFDHGRGIRPASHLVDGQAFSYWRCGGYMTRKCYRRESLWNMRVSGWLGGVGNIGTEIIRNARQVLDISGGDSFSDIYGSRRYRSIALTKLVAIEQHAPLILLPQTYGPFRHRRFRQQAGEIVVRAQSAWARDARSFESLRELAGDRFDPAVHRSGVDVAFLLDPSRPEPDLLAGRVGEWLEQSPSTVAGLNVSGLLYNREDAVRSFGIRQSYRSIIEALAATLLARTDCKLLLIPHVLTLPGHKESDEHACHAVAAGIEARFAERVAVLPAPRTPGQAKWVIGKLDWFCGTRMHSTIAALSSGVPAAAIAYSDKTLGVFETCNQGRQVFDPRNLDDLASILEPLMDSHARRASTRENLRIALPQVQQRARLQMAEILGQTIESPSRP